MKIIESTIRLIEEKPSGEPGVREIASAAGTSLGLINYYFGSRERLIREAVRFHINTHVILPYSPDAIPPDTKMIPDTKMSPGTKTHPVHRMSMVILGVLNYIMEHPKLARASILNDLTFPEPGDNADLSCSGLKEALVEILGHDIAEKDYIALWSVIGSIHEAFLRPELFHARCGFTLEKDVDRQSFALYLAEILM